MFALVFAPGAAAILLLTLLGVPQTPAPQPQTPPAGTQKTTSTPTTPPTPQAPGGSPKPTNPAATPKQTPAPTTPPTGTPATPGQPAQTPPAQPATTPAQPPANQFVEPTPQEPTAVTAEPNPCLPGQTVTFYLPAGAKRATVRGGRYTHSQEIQADDPVSDEPKKTTTYVFDVVTPGESAGTGNATPKPAQRQEFRVAVDVLTGAFPKLVTYRNPQHWHIDTVVGWIRNVIPQADPATESLIYFQPQDDSPERVSVAVMPVKEGATCADLMQKALMDAPTQYDVFEHVQQKATAQCGVSAIWATFDGVDHALPDMPTKSMVLTFVRNGIGYVVSGRARASRFDQWEQLLHSLVRSIGVDPEPQQAKADPQHADAHASAEGRSPLPTVGKSPGH
jgi:hypothetical protein